MLLGHVARHHKSVRATFTQWDHRLLTLQENTGAIWLGNWKDDPCACMGQCPFELSGQHPVHCRYIIQKPTTQFQVFVTKMLKMYNTVRYFENEGTFK